MQRYFYAGLFKRVRSMGVTDVIAQLPLIFNNYIHTDMDLTTIAGDAGVLYPHRQCEHHAGPDP